MAIVKWLEGKVHENAKAVFEDTPYASPFRCKSLRNLPVLGAPTAIHSGTASPSLVPESLKTIGIQPLPLGTWSQFSLHNFVTLSGALAEIRR